jgi:hypothetical protein
VSEQDLRVRLNLPGAFQWAGVDVFLNGHEHIVEFLQDETVAPASRTSYIVTGAGSDVRTNNVLVPLSKFLLEDNGFTVHSANATHMMHSVVDWEGNVVYSSVNALLVKQRDAPTAVPTDPALAWLVPGYTPPPPPTATPGPLAAD